MVGKLKVLLACLLCLPLLGAWPNTGQKYPPAGAAAYSGPGDVVAGAKLWYGLRAYSNALANAGATTTKVMDVRGVTTAGACTIFLLGNGTGGLDLTTAGAGGIGNQCLLGATTFCTSTNTSCTISKLYDQTAGGNCTGVGTTCDITQATAANQPTLTFAAVGGNAAITCVTANAQFLQAGNVYTNAGTAFTLSVVSKFTGSTQSAVFAAATGLPQVGSGIVGGDYFMYAGTVVEEPAAGSVFHATQAAFNGGGGNDSFYIDGTSNTGLSAGGGPWGPGGSAPTLCSDSGAAGHPWGGVVAEAGFWQLTFSAGQQSNENSNQHTYWGF